MGQHAEKSTYRVRWSEGDGEHLATMAEFPSPHPSRGQQLHWRKRCIRGLPRALPFLWERHQAVRAI